MSQKTKERIRLLYGIALSVLILAAGVCFSLSCLSIYQSGESPFTRESIATHWGYIAIPVYICLFGVLGGYILALVLPCAEGRVKPRREASAMLSRLCAKLDMDKCDVHVAEAIRKERSSRRVWLIQSVAITAVSVVIPVVWCLMPNRFSVEHLNHDIRNAALMILPFVVASLVIWADTVVMWDRSIANEIGLVKSALATGGRTGIKKEKALSAKGKFASDPRFVWAVRGIIFVVGVVFVLLGIFNGGMADVLGKAIRICTECIGLG